MANDKSSFRPYDEQMAYRFRVNVPGMDDVGFEKVSGLGGEIDVIERRTGSEPDRNRKLPGLVKINDVTLSHGVTKDNSLFEWWEMVKNLAMELEANAGMRKDLTIEEVGAGGAAVKVWRLFQCWPTSYKGGDFDAQASEVLVEELVLAVEDIQLESGSGSTGSVSHEIGHGL